MSSEKLWRLFAGLFVVGILVSGSAIANAQKNESKEKPALYTYVANWAIPRAQWGEMAKSAADDQKILDKDIADGTLVGYGSDENLIHQPDSETHDDWWSSMTMAGIVKVLDQFSKSGASTTPLLSSATKHWDNLYVSHYYNWRSGSVKGAYTRVQVYKLKADASDDAVATLSKNVIVPVMEKLLADGTIAEYEIDEQMVHTTSPDMFMLAYIATNAEGLDKVNAAVHDFIKANPLSGPTFDSMVDFTAHRDELLHTDAMYK